MSLRAADLEVLFTVDTSQVEKAEKEVKQTGERIEKKPLKVEADATGALQSMDRIEAQAKKLVSADTMLKLDAEVDKAQAQIDKTKQRLEELQVKSLAGLDVRAETGRAEAQLQKAQRSLDKLLDAKQQIELDADASAALDAMAKVSAEGRRLVSQEVVTKVDTEISFAQKKVTRFEADLEVLRSKTPTVKVLADTAKAESALKEARGRLDDLNSARAVMVVDADVSAAEDALEGAVESGDAAGADTGKAFGGSIIAALASIPIAGAVVGIAAAAGSAFVSEFQDALQVEVGYDRLAGLTGISEVDALRLGRAAGEAYVQNFGESIEANMDTTRLALQFDIIDADSSVRSSQKVVEGLSGIANALEEDVRPVAAAVTTLLGSGMASSSAQAFDILAKGAQGASNKAGDLLDTFTEYPVVLTKLGISGEEMLGLIEQGLANGARNSDVAADALKEFQIRATDGSEASAKGFERLGLSAEEMTAKIASGGEGAREGLDQVLDGLRAMTDPVERNAAAVELFGTKAEDMGDALFALDLSTAVDQLGQVEGAAQRMFDTLADNDATRVEGALRNIEVAADGLKGALASALGEPLGEFADWVSSNRGPVLQFFTDLVNGAIDFAISANEGFGDFVSGPLADMVDGLVGVVDIMNKFRAPWDQIDTSGLTDMADGMRDFDGYTDAATGKLEAMRDQFNDFADPQVTLGYLNDATMRLAGSIDEVGYAADGSLIAIEGMDVANLSASESGALLEEQLVRSVEALNAELGAAAAAGEGQEALTDRYNAGTEALMGQLTNMGLTEQQAYDLITAYGGIPETEGTSITSNAVERSIEIDGLTYKIQHLPDGTSQIVADTRQAQIGLDSWINSNSGRTVSVGVVSGGYAAGRALGSIDFMAAGGIAGLSQLSPIAQMVPPSTWRVVGDRSDVPEAFVPLDGSARSWSILMEAFSRMPGAPQMMAQGAISGDHSGAVSSATPVVYVQNPFTGEYLLGRVADVAGGVVSAALRPVSRGSVRDSLGVR
ncbi:MAG: phage tail tape measure protein [Hyphomicrobium sp.]|jgi:hypothetical protein